ncbi:MAG: pyruvate formate lyase family protein [Anaerolineaceae bacterium]|nr:pyruvate formate lyase family protein [Anaerolineaceae bacterium]
MFVQRHSWQEILERNRQAGSIQKKYDLGLYWRACAFREAASEAEPLLRAYAFQKVLEHIPIQIDGGLLPGTCAMLTSDNLPESCTGSEYQILLCEHQARGQRDFWAGFDHSLADYPTLLTIGIGGFRRQVKESLARHANPDEQNFLYAVDLTLQALSTFIRRVGEAARQAGQIEAGETCLAVTEDPPHTFHQALQLVWLVHLVFKSEGRCHMALGRIDQYLHPFYQRDLASGTLNNEKALDLFCHLWARLDEIGEVQNICIGGLTPEGEDATNQLSYLCLEATRLVQSPHTNLSARFHDGSPEPFHRACFEVIRTGIGFPAIFNDHVLLEGLAEIGIPAAVARDYCMVGFIETMLPGRQPAWSDSRFNTPLYLLAVLQRLISEPLPSYFRLVDLFRE